MSLNLLRARGKNSIVRGTRVSKGEEERERNGGMLSFIYPLSLSLRLAGNGKCWELGFGVGRKGASC